MNQVLTYTRARKVPLGTVLCLVFQVMTVSLGGWSVIAHAEHPVTVEQRYAAGDYLQALATYQRIPERVRTTASIVAAARSAVALSASPQAISLIQQGLLRPDLGEEDRARLHVLRVIVEFQESRYHAAATLLGQAEPLLQKFPLVHAQALLLWGDVLSAHGQKAAAEQKYQMASTLNFAEFQDEIAYRLGMIQAELGKRELALESLQKVSVTSERAPRTIQMLAQLSYDLGRHEDVAFWIAKGKSDYPDAFVNSWNDYALVTGALTLHKPVEAEEHSVRARATFPPSDPWITLLNGALEAYRWVASQKQQSEVTYE